MELAQAVPLLYAAIEDRKPEVRQKAQEAVLAFMIHLGYDRMLKMAGKLKVKLSGNSWIQIKGIAWNIREK